MRFPMQCAQKDGLFTPRIVVMYAVCCLLFFHPFLVGNRKWTRLHPCPCDDAPKGSLYVIFTVVKLKQQGVECSLPFVQ